MSRPFRSLPNTAPLAVRAEAVGDSTLGVRIDRKGFVLAIDSPHRDDVWWKLERLWRLRWEQLGEIDKTIFIGPLPLKRLEQCLEEARLVIANHEQYKLARYDLLTQPELDNLPL